MEKIAAFALVVIAVVVGSALLVQLVSTVTGFRAVGSAIILFAIILTGGTVYSFFSEIVDKHQVAAFKEKQQQREKILAEESAERAQEEAVKIEQQMREEKAMAKVDGHIENIVNALRAMKTEDISSILLSTIDQELQQLLGGDLIDTLKKNQPALDKLELAYQVMLEKGVSDRFVINTFDQLRSRVSTAADNNIKLIVTNT